MYYKDVDNDLDNFIGIWKYVDGNTSLTITLQKKEMTSYSDNFVSYYEDVLVGEYKYIENGVEKVNTLSQLSPQLPNSYDYHIFGNIIVSPPTNCLGCVTNMRAVHLGFTDPNREILGMESKMVFVRPDSGGVQKLCLKFLVVSGGAVETGTIPLYTEYTVPFGESF